MVKTLKRKFLKTAMTAVTALLLLFIISVNAFNIFFTVRQNNQKLNAVCGDMFRREDRFEIDDDDDAEPPDMDEFKDDFREKRELPKEDTNLALNII